MHSAAKLFFKNLFFPLRLFKFLFPSHFMCLLWALLISIPVVYPIDCCLLNAVSLFFLVGLSLSPSKWIINCPDNLDVSRVHFFFVFISYVQFFNKQTKQKKNDLQFCVPCSFFFVPSFRYRTQHFVSSRYFLVFHI